MYSFWQEECHHEIPGNKQLIINQMTKCTRQIVVQNKITYQEMINYIEPDKRK